MIDSVRLKQNEVVALNFINNLEGDIELARDNYGSVEYKEYFVGDLQHQVCFSEYYCDELTKGGCIDGVSHANPDSIDNEQVKDIISGNVAKNVFVIGEEKIISYYIPGIIIENLSLDKYGCFNVTEGHLKIRLEARVKGTLVGDPYPWSVSGDCVIKIPDLMNTGRLKPVTWKKGEKYFIDDSGKIIQVCGPDGWTDVKLI